MYVGIGLHEFINQYITFIYYTMFIKLIGYLAYGYAFHLAFNWVEGNPQPKFIEPYVQKYEKKVHDHIYKKLKQSNMNMNNLNFAYKFIYNKIKDKPHVKK